MAGSNPCLGRVATETLCLLAVNRNFSKSGNDKEATGEDGSPPFKCCGSVTFTVPVAFKVREIFTLVYGTHSCPRFDKPTVRQFLVTKCNRVLLNGYTE